MQSLLEKLDALIIDKRGDYYITLQPGLQEAGIKQLEQQYNITLPEDLKQLYQWKNGQSEDSYEAFVNNSMFIPLKEALSTAAENTSMIGNDFELENWWHPAWIPLFHNGGGDYICYDTAGTFGGMKGQLIEFWHADNDRSIIAPDLATFIDTIGQLYADNEEFDEYFEVKPPEGYPQGHFAG